MEHHRTTLGRTTLAVASATLAAGMSMAAWAEYEKLVEMGYPAPKDGEYVFPAPWGDGSHNWGAGIVRTHTAAGFIKNNMPLAQPLSLSDQEAWDIAYYMTRQERPQDPRYTGDVEETLETFGPTFHKHSSYGQEREHDGHRLADHTNWGEKGEEVKPWNVGQPRFEDLED